MIHFLEEVKIHLYICTSIQLLNENTTVNKISQWKVLHITNYRRKTCFEN